MHTHTNTHDALVLALLTRLDDEDYPEGRQLRDALVLAHAAARCLRHVDLVAQTHAQAEGVLPLVVRHVRSVSPPDAAMRLALMSLDPLAMAEAQQIEDARWDAVEQLARDWLCGCCVAEWLQGRGEAA